jgi:hypothetical protein
MLDMTLEQEIMTHLSGKASLKESKQEFAKAKGTEKITQRGMKTHITSTIQLQVSFQKNRHKTNNITKKLKNKTKFSS